MTILLCVLSIVTALLGWATIRLALDLRSTQEALGIVIRGLGEAGLLDEREEES